MFRFVSPHHNALFTDVYHFLKDPPSGAVPRISVIAVSGLAGMILARKGE